jgi:DNA-binding IclR family transcriptional regulator
VAATVIDRGSEPISATSDAPPARADSSAAKALAMLDAFAGPRAVLGVTELARAIGVPKSTAHRLLSVMIDSGFVRKTDGRYCLTERVFELGNRAGAGFVRSTGLRQRAMPFLSELFVGTRRETIHLAALTGTDVLYLEKLFGSGGMHCPTAVGMRRPAYATALGKALLAFASDDDVMLTLKGEFRRFTSRTLPDARHLELELERIRAAGLATDHGEMKPDLHCIAAPILDLRTGHTVAAVSVCSLTSRNLESKYGRVLLDVARDLSRFAYV